MSRSNQLRPQDAPTTAAFYLPQFHSIPENDQWWGEGFTEWTNVARATPLFPGHDQPRVSATPFGEYDLLNPRVLAWQVEEAKAHDVDAFVFYHYWFAGSRLLERPVELFLDSDLDHSFAICWANENWTRRWDGKEKEVLMGQTYGPDSFAEVFESFLPALRDRRYLRRDGAAVLLVHRADHLPDPRRFAAGWRRLAREQGLGELWLVASETHAMTPEQLGFDATAEFPPVGDTTLQTALSRLPRGTVRPFRGRMCSYRALAEGYMGRATPSFARHPTVIPRWDNTARRRDAATLYLGSTPQIYGTWLAHARERERSERGSAGIVFINAWNEWAEGAYLEPDERWGHDYLRMTRWGAAVDDSTQPGTGYTRGRPNVSGLARGAARSALTVVQSLRKRLGR
ncbi:MAG: glycoside hydrolase family 99-like domain-containing protein [Propionibacteriaceae bacterium]|jgi:lipopolysaccharide biosynthesis protein|nr:glycoside hydrolase family 99-like domain-containing protein [Propionibacteriaceae bacterium]HRY11130.1 glycoside hydrolase family 99-like domain-containing protein [Candidatus Nanopelagicales bacterium]